jgi:hypothetical protein
VTVFSNDVQGLCSDVPAPPCDRDGQSSCLLRHSPKILSLSNGGHEVCWWMTGFKAISLSLDQGIEILCDYQQTVGLLTKVDPELKTILRQKVQQGNIHISWKPMSEMRHDKSPALKHQEFTKVFGLREMIR